MSVEKFPAGFLTDGEPSINSLPLPPQRFARCIRALGGVLRSWRHVPSLQFGQEAQRDYVPPAVRPSRVLDLAVPQSAQLVRDCHFSEQGSSSAPGLIVVEEVVEVTTREVDASFSAQYGRRLNNVGMIARGNDPHREYPEFGLVSESLPAEEQHAA
jgi:hypothetical protein